MQEHAPMLVAPRLGGCEDFPGLCELSNGIFGEDLGL